MLKPLTDEKLITNCMCLFLKELIFCLIIFYLILGCPNSHKKNCTLTKFDDLGKNIFVNKKINMDSCSIIVDRYDRTDFFIIKKGNKFGLINDKKHLLLPLEYDTIERPRLADYFFITKNHLCGVVTSAGILTIPIYYEHIEYDWKNQKSGEEDCFLVQKNQKLGSIDFHNKIIIPVEYDGISNWVEYGPRAHYVKKNHQYGLIDYNSGKLIIPVIYDGLVVHRTNCIEIKKDGLYGIIDYNNKEIIPCIYSKIYVDFDFWGFDKNHKDLIFAENKTNWCKFDVNGKMISSNVPMNQIDKKILAYKPDSNEYRYHLKDCMLFPR
jgi:hypothetical protein